MGYTSCPMSKAFKGFITICLVAIAGLIACPRVYAETVSSSDSLTVTAIVEATRSVLINPQGRIIRILSNTPEAVAPKFYQTSFESGPIASNQSMLDQYNKIVDRIDTSHAGVIYSWSPAPKPTAKYSVIFTIGLNLVTHYI